MVGLITSQKSNSKIKNSDLEQTNELLYLSRMQDQEALRMLLNLYLPTIHSIYHRFNIPSRIMTMEEWVNDSYMIVCDLVDLYREDMDACFGTCLYKYLVNKARNVLRVQTYKKTIPADKIVSLQATNADGTTVEWERYSRTSFVQFENDLINHLTLETVLKCLQTQLSQDEMKVLIMMQEGYPTSDVAKKMDITKQKVYRIVRKASDKWKYVQQNSPLSPFTRVN